MAQKVIIELEAKTDEALKGIEELQKSNQELSKQIIDGNKKQVKATNTLAKGFKGVGLAMKAAGFGLVMKIVDGLSASLMRNQEIADTVNTVFTAIGIVFKQVSDVMLDVFNKVSDATGGFDALQKVLGGALSISINLVVGAIQGMMLGVKKAQLAWEDSFLGGKDPETIKRLQGEIDEVSNKLDETGERIKKAGGDIADNFVEAVGEVGQLATGVAEGVSEAIEKIDVKTALSNAKRLVENKKNYGLLEAQSQRLIEKYDLEAETQRQLRDDDRKSLEERIAANNELGKVLNKQAEEEKNQIEIRKQAIQEQIRLEGDSVELKEELYSLNTELIAIDAKVAGFKSEQLTNEASLQRELNQLTKDKLENESQLSTERQRFNAEQINDELLKLERLKEIDLLEQEREQLRLQAIVDNANAGTQAKIDAQIVLDDFNEQSRQTNLTRNQEIAKAEQELDKQKIKDKQAVVNAISQFADAESGVGKALLIVKQGLALKETLMDLKRITFKGVEAVGAAGVSTAENVAQSSKIGFPQNLITIAGAIAQGIGIVKSVKSAVSKTKAKAGGAGASVPSIPTPSLPKAPSLPPAFNVVGSSNTNQLAEAIGGQSKEPTRAYVVSNDVTTAQSMDRNIVDGASI